MESSTEDSEHSETIENADKMASEAAKIVNNIRRFCAKDPTRMISRDVGNQIMDMVGGLNAIVAKLVTRNIYLKGVLDGTTKERESVMKAIDEGFLDKVGQQMQVPTFAQVAQSTPTQKIPAISGLPRRVPTLAKTVILKRAEGSKEQTGEEFKAKVLSIVNPKTEKMKVGDIRKTHDGGLVLEMATEEDLIKIMDHDALRKEGIKATIA